MAEDDVRIEHPNRKKASSKASRAVVILLLLVSAALVLIVTIGGWDALQGAKLLQIVYVVIYLGMAYYVARWNRGVLPVAAALAIIMAIFAAIAAPQWFARDKPGLSSPALPENLLGLLTLVVVPVQLALVAVAMLGFNQNWHVEEERRVGGTVPAAYADEDEDLYPADTAADDAPAEAEDAADDGDRAPPAPPAD
jgi:cytoskeletal protein RodZ